MKLECFVLQSAIYEGQYEKAVHMLLEHFGINLPGVEFAIKIDHDSSYGIRAWVGEDPYEWYEGSFYFPASDWSTDRDYSSVKTVSATVWSKYKNS